MQALTLTYLLGILRYREYFRLGENDIQAFSISEIGEINKVMISWAEYYDPNDLLVLISYLARSAKPKDLLVKNILVRILENVKDNQLLVNYRHCRGSSFGRLYADIGYQILPKDIRAYLARDFYFDIDIANASPTIITQLAEMNHTTLPRLGDYCVNREKWLSKISKTTGVDRNSAKELVIRLLFGGQVRYWLKDCRRLYLLKHIDPRLFELENEISEKTPIICNLAAFAEIRANVENDSKDRKGYNQQGRILGKIYQKVESQILQKMIEFFRSQGKMVDCLMFDGLFIRRQTRDEQMSHTLLASCENHVFETTGYRVQLVEKKMSRAIISKNINTGA